MEWTRIRVAIMALAFGEVMLVAGLVMLAAMLRA